MSDTAKKDVVVVAKNAPAKTEPLYDRVLQLAIETGDLTKIEKFMELQERHEANEAKKAFNEAMSSFKANPPEIEKDKEVNYSGTNYKHASLANVTAKINKALSDHGLSATWKTDQGDKGLITVTCTISHVFGHAESTSLSASPDNSGSKNAIQAIGSTISYLERYTILALTGLATHDIDDDGAGSAPTELITADQQIEIDDLLEDTGSDIDRFLKFMGVESTDKIPARFYGKAKNALKRKAKQ